MPELPEVETMRRGIAAAAGGLVVGIEKMPCPCKPIHVSPAIHSFRKRVVGTRITQLSRIGKRVVIWLDSEEAIVIEPRMTGLVLVVNPPTMEHLRWRMVLEDCQYQQILYWDRRGLGNVRLLSKNNFQEQFGSSRLGPDALQITALQFEQQLGHSKREIKPALLDQRAVAGIGNLYASEILHVAGIHPQRCCALMNRQQWQAITIATHKVLLEAIQHEGSTLSDGTYRNALNKQGGYQNQHRVYDRAGKTCPRCQSSQIQRIVQTQRSTFFCAGCQKRKGALL
tara:strand:- start:77 stop:928 length:852 start_codon:yes stop_codon:yes gene_type:complete